MNNDQQKTTYINQLQAGMSVNDIFLVSKKQQAKTKAGKPFLTLGLMDKTGELDAKVWDRAEEYDALVDVNDIVRVQAASTEYNGRLQLTVKFLSKSEKAGVDFAAFMPASKRPIEEMADELDQIITGVQDVPLRELLAHIFHGQIRDQFLHAPAAKKMHHAYLGGLAEHTLSIVAMAKKAAAHYSILNEDMLVAGALLHDIAKIKEFDYSSPAFQYTDQGRLVGHLVLGVDMVRTAATGVEGLSAQQLDQLIHLILSHHGQLEYGSPVLPMTPEALILHHLDDMDAKMNVMEQLRDNMSGPGWQWTDYQRPLERFLYLNATEENGPASEAAEVSPQVEVKRRHKPLSAAEAVGRQQSLFG